MISVDREIGP